MGTKILIEKWASAFKILRTAWDRTTEKWDTTLGMWRLSVKDREAAITATIAANRRATDAAAVHVQSQMEEFDKRFVAFTRRAEENAAQLATLPGVIDALATQQFALIGSVRQALLALPAAK
jgi:hypothetical protein